MSPLELVMRRIAASIGQTPKEFSLWDYLAGRSDSPEIAIAYSALIWPQFVEIGGFVLLAEHYDADYLERVLRDYGPTKVEATINTTYLENVVGGKGAPTEVWEALGGLLCETWVARAEQMFPNTKFIAQFSWYSEGGDPGITIFRVTKK